MNWITNKRIDAPIRHKNEVEQENAQLREIVEAVAEDEPPTGKIREFYEWEAAKLRRESAQLWKIVEALADCEPIRITGFYGGTFCPICEWNSNSGGTHAPDCPYRMAREWKDRDGACRYCEGSGCKACDAREWKDGQ